MPSLPRFPLAQLVERDRNNLDLVRLICACGVIFGHAFILAGDPAYPSGTWDPTRFLHYEGIYSASLAVKIFFFISGLLVTNSLLTKRSVTHYLFGRFFRLWPALIVVLLVSTLLVGPLLTHLPRRLYFAHPETWQYFGGNLLMLPPGRLPGVFVDNPLPHLVNATLWTLRYEVGAYTAILLAALLGVFRYRALGVALALVAMIDPILPHPLLFRWLPDSPQMTYLPPCFAFGALLALLKDRVTLTPALLLGAGVAFALARTTAAGPLLFLLTLFLFVLYFAGLSWVKKIRFNSDISYGTFLWGFLIQQMLAARCAELGLPFNLAAALLLALLAGALSWHFIERPALRIGARWQQKFARRDASSSTSAPAVGELLP